MNHHHSSQGNHAPAASAAGAHAGRVVQPFASSAGGGGAPFNPGSTGGAMLMPGSSSYGQKKKGGRPSEESEKSDVTMEPADESKAEKMTLQELKLKLEEEKQKVERLEKENHRLKLSKERWFENYGKLDTAATQLATATATVLQTRHGAEEVDLSSTHRDLVLEQCLEWMKDHFLCSDAAHVADFNKVEAWVENGVGLVKKLRAWGKTESYFLHMVALLQFVVCSRK